MKICFVTTIHQSMDWFVADAAKYFHDKGHDVYYICNMNDNFINEHKSYAKCIDVKMNRGFSPINMLKSMLIMYRIFKKEKFDCIQYATPNASFIGSIAAKLAGIKYRVYAFWGMRYEGARGINRKILIQFEKITCLLSTHVRIVSPKNMEIVIKDRVCPRHKIGVIGLGGTIGVNTRIFDISKKEKFRNEIRTKLGLNDNDFLFTFIGRINADKGVNELIEAFKTIQENYKNTKLLLLGMEDSVNPIKYENKLWAQNAANVFMLGAVHKDSVCKYLSASDILVHPTYREGFGKIIQEAMSMKVPVITTNIPGPSEVIEENISGLLIPKADTEALANAMIYLYENRTLANQFAEAGYKRFLDNFTMEKMVKNIYMEYSKITNLY